MKIKTKLLSGAILSALLSSQAAIASPFETCPSKAFLIQGTSTINLYGINLATGDYSMLNTFTQTNKGINGLAYNFFDNYMYGWSRQYLDLVKIDSNYNLTRLNISGRPAGLSNYVADVSPNVNKYYYYHPSHGIHSINLDPSAADYLVDKVVTTSGTTGNLYIYDWAVNPSANENFAYSVNKNGQLLKINLNPANTTTNPVQDLGNVGGGATGTFGAVYFDANDNVYISNNKTGKIYRIKVTDANPTAELFANGPTSSSNDGGRCAIAPIIDTSEPATIDFGDAPDSYGTTLDSNGARHTANNSSLFMGNIVDVEHVAYPDPLSDDTHGSNDDDGVTFITGTNTGQTNLLQIQASGSGYINAWIDWNKNGEFDTNEQILDGQSVKSGQNLFTYTTPAGVTAGETWARFRLSSDQDVEATGGVGDGEVEDYKITINNGTTTTYYPGENSWTTIAFEDEWPLQNDYDLNDIAFQYRTGVSEKDGKITHIVLTGQLHANGGDYHNGFAVRLPGIARGLIDEANILYTINGMKKGASPLETGTTDAVFIATNDIRNYTGRIEGCNYFRTEEGCDAPVDNVFEFTISAPFKTGQEPLASSFPSSPYDPFIFATPNTWRHHMFNGVNPGRGLEIHMKNQAPTSKFNASFYGMADDRSDPDNNLYFQNENGLPWAIEVPGDWEYPKEKTGLLEAYPKFKDFVESKGARESTWFSKSKANANKVFRGN